MARYTTVDRYRGDIPTGLPTNWTGSLQEWEAKLDEFILLASEIIESKLGNSFTPRYHENTQMFPDISDVPKTPEVIIEIANAICKKKVMKYFESHRGKLTDSDKYLHDWIEAQLKAVRTGSTTIYISGVNVQQVDYTGDRQRPSFFDMNEMERF